MFHSPILLNNCRTSNPRIRITLNPTLICEYIVRKLFLQCRPLYTFNSNIRFESDDQTSCSYKLVQVLFEILLALWVLLENLSFPISPEGGWNGPITRFPFVLRTPSFPFRFFLLYL
uniref:Ovule protein n=1 Tax=Heterorhabditis bacteriophora TaxID=37862 RepID=A0A1I7WFF5_HETBA